jgi:Fic family protein
MTLASMEPLVPEEPALRQLAGEIYAAAEGLGRHLHPATLAAVADLLRTVNCYYSNLIEGHDTHPVYIERAMQQEYAPSAPARGLQLEARAHIEVQRLVEERMAQEPALNVCAPEFLRWIHREFYERLPEDFRIVRDRASGREEAVIPGMLRHHDVRVGRHVPISPAELPVALERFAAVYDPVRHPALEALVLLGPAHHRLLWIHPFGDGNGRVTRLMTDAYLRRIGVGGHGLWTASRGLARRRDQYKAALSEADAPRWDDYDGRGALSHRALVAFSRFFLEVCADQVRYMAGLLQVDGFARRVESYGKAREAGVLPDRHGGTDRTARFRPEATRLLRDLVYRGTVPRGEVPALLNLEERTARRVVRRLSEEGFLESESSRAPIRFRIPAHAAPYFFPELYNPTVTGPAEHTSGRPLIV